MGNRQDKFDAGAKDSAVFLRIAQSQISVVGFDYALHDRQSESRSRIFRRVKRVEELRNIAFKTRFRCR